jgi:predicted MFS family arabinose efflux permease
MIALSRRAAFLALGVIFAANFLSYLDRTLVSALEEPLKDAFNLSAEGHGWLWALFTFGYMVFAMPIGMLADRRNRPRILALCVVIWSFATITSGWAPSSTVLYVSRFFIGVGEAGCLIIGQALIADYFRKEVRGRALSLFHAAVPLGGTCAFIMAGALGKILDWRELFYIAGAPGFLVAALILLLVDPPRGGEEPHKAARSGFKAYVELLRTPTLLFVIFGQAFAMLILVCIIHFGIKFFTQVRGMGAEEAKISFGVMALVSGALGNMVGGALGDWLAKRIRGGYALLAGISYWAALPLLLYGFHASERWISFSALTAGSFCLFLCMPVVNAQIASVTHPDQRGAAWALAIFILHLFGDTFNPPLFGAVSDTYGRLNAFTWFSFSLVLAGLCCLLAARFAGRDIAKVQARLNPTPPPGPV